MIEPMLRCLAPQRSISLYKDQEESIKRIIKNHGLSNISVSKIIRTGVDLVIAELKEEGEKAING